MKTFIVAQVLIRIIEGKINLLHPLAHAFGLSDKCLKQVFCGCVSEWALCIPPF